MSNQLFRGSTPSQPDWVSLIRSGDPREAERKVREALSSGSVSQSQLDSAFNQALQIGKMLGLK